MSNEPTRISRAAANERIAMFFEPKPDDLPQHYYETTPKSPLGYWKWLGMGLAFGQKRVAHAEWCPNNYAHKIKAAWELLGVKVKGGENTLSDLINSQTADKILQPSEDKACRGICAAFLYAVEGIRYEITD